MAENTGDLGPEGEDRRQYERVTFSAAVELVKNCTVWKTELMDISLKGILVQEPGEWRSEDGTYEIRIKLSDATPTGEIKMQGTVAHETGDRIGFEQVGIESQSLTQLRKVLELNLDPEQLERELTDLIG